MTCPTRGENTLDHCYSQFKDGYRSLALSPFGKSDHDAIFLLPKYQQCLKHTPAVSREVKRWSADSENMLQAALDCTDWSVFRDNTDHINDYTETVLDFVGTLVEDIVPSTTIRVFPNQKPWVDKSVREALNARTSAYNAGLVTGSMDEHKAARYNLRRTVTAAKGRYRDKVELQFEQADSRGMWQGLRTMTDYKGTPPMLNTDVSLANELNTFYARFEAVNNNNSPQTSAMESGATADGDSVFRLTEHEVRRSFKKVNIRKAAGPDGIPGRVLKVCADQLAPVFTDIFNLSLEQSVIPTCLKRSTIVPVPKKSTPACLNDYRPVALTSIAMKCFEGLVKGYICSSLPPTLDPLQFAYRPNRSTEDAIAHVLHTAASHLDKRQGNYVRMLFIDYSSAFNTIVPSKLVGKLRDLGLNYDLCQWVLDFLTGRPQVVRAGNCTSSSITLNTGAPQGCVLSPLLYSLYTHDCVAKHNSNTIIKFADDTAVMGLISGNDERAYLGEVENLALWCQGNSLSLNVSKTKEMIVDFRRSGARDYSPLSIYGAPVERVSSFKYLGVHISEDLTWTTHIDSVVKKARQRLYFLRRLRKFKMSQKILKNFYSCTIESILTGNITSWFGNTTAHDRSRLQRVARSAERTIGGGLPTLQDIYTKRCKAKAMRIVKDSSHPNNCLFALLRSGKRYRSLMASTERLRRSFYPQAIRMLNDST